MIDSGKPVEALPPTLLLLCLAILALLVAVAGTAWGAVILLDAPGDGALSSHAFLLAASCVLAGWAGWAFLWSLAWLIRRHYEAARTEQDVLLRLGQIAGSPLPGELPPPTQRPSHPADATPADATPAEAELTRRILEELAEINANLLMSSEQREAKGRREHARRAERLVATIEQATADGEFDRARGALEQLRKVVPDEQRCDVLEQKIRNVQAAWQTKEIEFDRRRIEDLMAISEFDKARQAVEEIAARSPRAPHAVELRRRVEREAEAFAEEQGRRLYEQVQRSAETRQWRKALAAAEKLVGQFPKHPRAAAVLLQMHTLQENARLEEVRELRDRFTDMVERRRFAEAVAIAEDLVARFPDTQAAATIREQLGKLRELIEKR